MLTSTPTNIKHNKILAAFLGTIVEYYDYTLYVFSAAIIADKFFPSDDQFTALIKVFGIYAITYLFKPLGALFFSRIGDLYGRTIALRITIIGISVPTVIIGLLPEYSEIGILSTAIIVICRLAQGFFVAGEYDGAAIYVIEHLDKKYHYTASSITRATGVVGLLLGITVTNFFNSSLFPEWCWRVPFLLSAPLAALTLYFRRFLEEPDEYKIATPNLAEKTRSTIVFIKEHLATILFVALIAGGFGATYQISVIFMKVYMPIIQPLTSAVISSFSVLIVFMFGLSMPISGFLADKIGLSKVIKFSTFAAIISALAFCYAAENDKINLLLISSIAIAVFVAPFNALSHGLLTKCFASENRYRGITFGHTIGSMLFSGTANLICINVVKHTSFTLFPLAYLILFTLLFYGTAMLLISNRISLKAQYDLATNIKNEDEQSKDLIT